MKNKAITLATAAHRTNGAGIDLTSLLQPMGIAYATWGSAGLARLYGLWPCRPLPRERQDLRELASAVYWMLNKAGVDSPAGEEGPQADPGSGGAMQDPHEPAQPVVVTLRQLPNGAGELHLSLPGEPVPPRRLRVMVVDDEEAILQCLCLLLEAHGFSVLPLARGAGVLELAKKARPDAIVLDVDLPILDGLEVCRQLKEEPLTSEIPVLFCTGRLDIKEQALAAGGIDCLEKPLEIPEVPQRLRRVLGSLRTEDPSSPPDETGE